MKHLHQPVNVYSWPIWSAGCPIQVRINLLQLALLFAIVRVFVITNSHCWLYNNTMVTTIAFTTIIFTLITTICTVTTTISTIFNRIYTTNTIIHTPSPQYSPSSPQYAHLHHNAYPQHHNTYTLTTMPSYLNHNKYPHHNINPSSQ